MKSIVLIFIMFSQEALACSCWTPPGSENTPSFLARVVDGDAIHPVSDNDRKRSQERAWKETRVIVVDPLNSGLEKGDIRTIKQSLGMCSERFFVGAIYRVEPQSNDAVIIGSTCNIHLINTDNVPKDTDQELLDLAKEVTELEQKVKQLE